MQSVCLIQSKLLSAIKSSLSNEHEACGVPAVAAYPDLKPQTDCRYDADVNVADRWNGTPLMAALRNGHLAIAKMLMGCEAKLGENADPALVQVGKTLLLI